MKRSVFVLCAAVLAAFCSISASTVKAEDSIGELVLNCVAAADEVNAGQVSALPKPESSEAELAKSNGAVASRVEPDLANGARVDVQEKKPQRALTRQEIRNMPLLERPNRPGHFYGNTVRRLYYRR
ncbi:MAG: hypothetical protein J6J31_08070 [Thermoguttaceae bacterium]|nr:hypothetical protein [Thermoguttaceae bacterium]